MYRKFMLLIIVFLLILLTACRGSIKEGESLQDLSLVWRDYEKATYDIYNDEDEKLVSIYYTIEKLQDTNENLYEISYLVGLEDGFNGTGATVDGGTFEVLSSYVTQIPPVDSEHERREITGTYEEGKMNIYSKKGDKEANFEVEVPQYVIDNESLLMMVRNFPLEEEYSKSINLALVGNGSVVPYDITVKTIETIEVPFGELQCYKVVMKYTGRGSVPDITVWYTTDENKVMARYEQQAVRFDLVEYEVRK